MCDYYCYIRNFTFEGFYMNLKEEIEVKISELKDWRDTTYEEEVVELAEYAIDLLYEILSKIDV